MNHVPQEVLEPQRAPVERKKHHRRFYSEKDRGDALAALQANGGNVWGTAKELGIPHATLNLWAATLKDPSEIAVRMQPAATVEVREASKRDLLATLDSARWLYLDRLMEPDAVAKTSGYYAAVTTKIIGEQHALLSGGATSRVELSLASFLRSTAIGEGGGEGNP